MIFLKKKTIILIIIAFIITILVYNKNDEIILVDYKTDYVSNNNGKELIDKYNGQLSIYKKALEQALNKKVEAVCIYSTYLEKEILIC